MAASKPGPLVISPVLSVIYVNYNTTQLLLDSLRSLTANLEIDSEVIIVDNASTTDPLDHAAVEALCPAAIVISSPENLGFGQGNNLGAQRASGEFLWILNTDTLIPPDCHIDRAISFLQTHPRHGAALPLLLNPDGSVQDAQTGRFPTALRILGDKLGVPGALFYRDSSTSRDVEFASCAALIIRSEVFRSVGGFSKEYFFFFEDTDLSRKLAAEGWLNRFVCESRLIHICGASIRRNAARKRIYYEHLDIYFSRWHGPVQRSLVWLMALPMRVRHGTTTAQMRSAERKDRVRVRANGG